MEPHILERVLATPWALRHDYLSAMLQRAREAGQTTASSPEPMAARPSIAAQGGGSIAVLPIAGMLTPKLDLWTWLLGGTSTDDIGATFRSLVSDQRISGIVLDVHSPGGSVYGVAELADTIYRARGQKPVIAVANSMAASGAYWIAAAADELVVTPGGEVGSVGVYSVHEDWSRAEEMAGLTTTYIAAGRYKVEGNSSEPLSEEARAAMQKRVDDYYGMFTAALATYRDLPVADVRGGFGEGRTVGAREAVRLGMADRVAPLDEVLHKLASANPRGTARAEAEPEPRACELDFRQRRQRLAAMA